MSKYPDKPNSQKDAQSHSVQSKMSYKKAPQPTGNLASHNQKMTKSIIQNLKKVYVNNQKPIFAAGFKSNQKTLLATIGSFLHSFDNSFDQNSLTIQMLPDTFKNLGYPYVINKTYFQPVGAPHTWPQCLNMMDWLGELAAFHADMRAHLEEQNTCEEDFTAAALRAHLNNDPNIAKNFLDEVIQKKAKQIQTSKYNIQTMKMQLQNKKSSQKSLKQLQLQQKQIEQTLYRQTQQRLQLQNQNSQLELQLKEVRARVKYQQRLNQMHDDEIVTLQRQVDNQELSVDEVERIKYQIKETREKTLQMKKNEEKEKEILDRNDTLIMNMFLEFSQVLEALKHLYKTHKHQIDRRGIYMQFPEYDVNKFRNFLKNRTEDCTDVSVDSILETHQVFNIQHNAAKLLAVIQKQIKELDENTQKIAGENMALNQQCIQKQTKNSQSLAKINQTKSKLTHLQNQIQQSQTNISHIMTQIKFLQMTKITLQTRENTQIDQAQKLLQQVNQLNQVCKTLKPQVDQIVQKKAMALIDLKVNAIQTVNELALAINQFNEDMGFAEFIERRKQQKAKENDNQPMNLGQMDEKQEDLNESIQHVRRDQTINADDEYDYTSLMGQGAFESPKPYKVNRMLNEYYRP